MSEADIIREAFRHSSRCEDEAFEALARLEAERNELLAIATGANDNAEFFVARAEAAEERSRLLAEASAALAAQAVDRTLEGDRR